MSRKARQTDIELLEAVRGGSTAAYGVLYQRHVGAARSLARQLVQGTDEVEEVLVAAFAQVLDLIRNGAGPVCAFRPYLLTAVRRYVTIGEVDLADPDHVHVDPELAGLERSAIARAYLALPEQWRMVLWHAEVEGAGHSELASFLALSRKGAATLVAQAREGLRQAYLRLHEETGPDEECRPILPKIVEYVEGDLPRRATGDVDEHIAGCIDCRSVFLELADLTQGLRVIVGPLVAGPAVDDYLADLAGTGDVMKAEPRSVPVLSRVPTPCRAALAGAAAAALAMSLFLLVSGPVVKRPLAGEEAALFPRSASGPPTHTRAPVGAASDASSPAPGRDRSRKAPPEQKTASESAQRAVSERKTASESARKAASALSTPRTRPTRSAPSLRALGGRSALAAPQVTRERVRRQARPPAGAGREGLGRTDPGQTDPGHTDLGRSEQGRSGVRRPALVAAIDPLGALVRARPGIVALRLRNSGTAAGQDVTATVRLPRGVMLMAAGTEDGWSCHTAGQRVRCARPGLAAGESSTLFLRVNVAADAPTTGGLGASVRSGPLKTVAESDSDVREAGAAARFAVAGRVMTRTAGNALLGPAGGRRGCASGESREPVEGTGDPGAAVPIDLDHDSTTRTSSCAHLDLPTGSRVLWAGLYWSAVGRESARSFSGREVKVRPPGAESYQTVRAAEVTHRERRPGYQAFADVTAMVRGSGRGRWWVADAPTGPGVARQAGWSLVVVAEDRHRPYGTATVLDVTDGSGETMTIPLDGLTPGGAPARVDLVLWNAGGGVVTMNDRSPRDAGRRGRRAGASAADAVQMLLGRRPVLRVTAGRDGLLFGVVAVTTRTWS
ncbi:hypothetical protein ACQP1K_01880 [Sphaerimonospora sp. CA-214678]|uniref:hypothetical protein n=1 Tax=Sphaerimonospora sp. CA-214678 TaxID=3240029 RepID=UPI003D942F45